MLSLLFVFFAFAEGPSVLPKWELGLGYFYGDIPDYPAAEQNTVRSFPVPYFIYRGDIVRADRDGGLRTRFLKGAMYEVDFSFSGAFPANSKDNRARSGMPDIDWLFEIGPQLKLYLLTNSKFRIQLRIPVRAIFSTDFGDIDHHGFSLSPEARISLPRFPSDKQILNLSYSHENATTQLHRVFYDVAPEFVTAERQAYSSSRGHIGQSYGISLVTQWNKLALFTGFSFSDFAQAENQASDLHIAKYNRSYFAGFIYSMFQSKEQEQR